MDFIYRTHAIERLFERDISEDDVEACVVDANIIEEYSDDKPYPSYLALGYEGGDITKPIHVVFAKNLDSVIIITAYRPDKTKWINKYQTRIK